MGRVSKKPAAEPEPTTPTVTQSRARRTPKPNPKYAADSVVGSKLDAIDAPIASDGEEKPVEVKKSAGRPAKATPLSKKTPPVKKQKLDLEDDEDEKVEESKPTGRATRSAKTDDSVKVGDASVAIVDVASIISNKPATEAAENNRSMRRKRGGADEPQPEEAPKKKKESEGDEKEKEKERPSAITTRKSYLPASAKKTEAEVKVESPKAETKPEVKTTLPAGIKVTRLNSGSDSSVKKEVIEVKSETKKLPFVRKAEPVKSPVLQRSPVGVAQTRVVQASKPVPRILNSLVSPKGKQSPNIKLTGDDRDKKVFSIDLTDDSIKERRMISSPVKPSPVLRQMGGSNLKENVRTPPSDVLRNRLENELGKMKANASFSKRLSTAPHSISNTSVTPNNMLARRITKFESWYVIDVKHPEIKPFRHSHSFSLITLGNNVQELKLPSTKWDYKVNLARRTTEAKEGDEVYTGEVVDKTIEEEKDKYEPTNILFKRSHMVNGKVTIDRSLMMKQNLYTITMNGKQCKLIGAPADIKTLEDLEILLDIINSTDLTNKCVELVTAEDMK